MKCYIKRLVVLWIFILLVLIPLYINIVILRYQTDPFIPTTIKIGQLISKFGSISNAQQYISNNWQYYGWQGHTIDFIQYEPLSGIFVYVMSSIMDMTIYKVAYLPIPLIIYVIMLYLISRWVYESFLPKSKIEKILMIFILSVSIYAYIGLFTIGTFYVFEYHGIYYIYALILYYLILKIIQCYKENAILIKKFIFIIIIVFLANLFNHYEIPLTFTCGIIIFALVIYLLHSTGLAECKNLLRYLTYLAIILIILVLSYPFYYSVLARTGGLIITLLIFFHTLINRVLKPEAAGQVITHIYQYGDYLIWSQKLWHFGFIIIVMLLTLFLIMYVKKLKSMNINIVNIFAYIPILGRDISWLISYFSVYLGSFSLTLKNAWILNSLVLAPILILSRLMNPNWKRVVVYILVSIITLSLLIWATLYIHLFIEGYSPYPGKVKDETKTISPFIQSVCNYGKSNIIIISGSLQLTSKLYEDLSLNQLNYLYPISAISFMKKKGTKQHLPVHEIYDRLKQEGVDFFVITSHELKNGFYGGLYIVPLSKQEVKELDVIFISNENKIYSSEIIRIYMLKN